MTYLKGVEDTSRILPVNYGIVLRIESGKLLEKRIEPFCFKSLLHSLTDILSYCRDIVYSITDGIDVHHTATGQ